MFKHLFVRTKKQYAADLNSLIGFACIWSYRFLKIRFLGPVSFCCCSYLTDFYFYFASTSWSVCAERYEQGEKAETVRWTFSSGWLLHQCGSTPAQVPGVPSGAVPQIQRARARRLNCGMSLLSFSEVLKSFLPSNVVFVQACTVPKHKVNMFYLFNMLG